MATTETRPSPLSFETHATPLPVAPAQPPRPARRRGLARRLPYVLAVLALALGYAVGHNTNNPAPKGTAPQSLVTPAQINAALTPSNGHTLLNDRGFSQLENGIQHTHGLDLPLTPAQRIQLARQMNLARETALRFPTLGDAEAAGMTRAGPFSPGLGTHMISPLSYIYSVGKGPMTDAQITHPLAWIYDGTKPSSPVAGLFYMSSVQNPQGFVGPNDIWHYHKNICIVPRAGGGIDTPLGADRDVTKAQCSVVHGSLITATGPLLHVWAVPGYEDSQGVYAHLNPAVTCSDGTYHIIDITKVGKRATICVDGTE